MKALCLIVAALTVVAAGVHWSVGDAVAVCFWWLVLYVARLAIIDALGAKAAAHR